MRLKILAVDASAILRQSWAIVKDGDQNDLVLKVIGAINKFADGFDRVVLCCDGPHGTSWRKLLLPTYKGSRVDPGETYKELGKQTLQRLVANGAIRLAAPQYIPEGITQELGKQYYAEADDVIGSLCFWAATNGHAVRILSCDKDMMQLVDDEAGIDLALTGDGMIYRERDVVASLAVAPCKVPLLKALAGDTSDEYKPYKGLGEGGAAKLIDAFAPGPAQGIGDIWAHIHDAAALLKNGTVAKLMEELGPEPARNALRLSTIVRSLSVNFEHIAADPHRKEPTPAPEQTQPAEIAQPVVQSQQPVQQQSVALVRRDGTTLPAYELEPKTPRSLVELCERLHKGGLYQNKYKNPDQMLAVIMDGRTMGMPANVALRSAYVVYGVASWSARAMRACCMRNPEFEYFRITEATLEAATAKIKRRGEPEFVLRITLDEAKRRGFLRPAKDKDKQTKWESDPKTMLIAAVEREGSRIVFPDSVTGLVCIDELEAHDGIIEGEVT